MGFTGLRPKNKGNPPDSLLKPSIIRDELQHVLGIGFPDCILPNDDKKTYGAKFSASGLVLTISKLKALIGGKYHRKDSATSLTLPVRKALLIYAIKKTFTDDIEPDFNYVAAELPPTERNTVLRYNLNLVGNIQNSAVGDNGNTLAIANDLVPTGTPTRVDGHVCYAIQGNGSTIYFTGQNAVNVPLYAEPFTLTIEIPYYSSGVAQCFYHDAVRKVATSATNKLLVGGVDTGITLVEAGKYLITVKGAGGVTTGTVYLNGKYAFTGAIVTNAVAVAPKVLGNTANAEKSPSTIEFVELLNARRSDKKIAQMAIKMLFPCSYDYLESTYYQSFTTSNIISGGDAVGHAKENVFDNDISTYWESSQASADQALNAYIGKSLLNEKIKLIVLKNSGNALNNMPSVLVQLSTNGGSTWTTIQAETLDTSPNAVNLIQLDDYSNMPSHQIILKANANLSTGATWIVPDMDFVTVTQSSSHDVREVLPADTMSVGYVETSSSTVYRKNDTDLKYGRLEGIKGGNREVFLGWLPYSGSIELSWENPFDTRKISTYFTWAEDINGNNETDITSGYFNSTSSYGIIKRGTTTQRIVVLTHATGVAYFNGAWKTSGCVGCYAKILVDI